MPFRHLLFNRRNGAPQRAPDQQPISLDSARFFSLDSEFPTYVDNRWPEEQQYGGQQSPAAYNSPMMQDAHYTKSQPASYHQTFDQSSMFPYNTMNGIPYQNSPYDFDSHSLRYSSDVMDTDSSSISQGSIHSSTSSTTHLDVMFDYDANSISSLSRKSSVISNMSQPEKLCPLLTGQVGRCDPQLCGPDAPCLQYINDGVVPPIEECVPEPTQRTLVVNDVEDQPVDFTTPHSSPQGRRQRQVEATPVGNVNPAHTLSTHVQTEEKKTHLRARRSSNKLNTSSTTDMKDDPPAAKQTKKTRARQAHSLVERKYRENLNAKIQELHQVLQKVQSSRSAARPASVDSTNFDDDEQDDMDDDGRSSSSKVKKSDVLVEAMHYVHSTEVELRRKDEEIQRLNDRISMMENWFRTGNSGQRGMM